MYKSYPSFAFRLIANQKSFSFINIAGLTLGITCSLLILLYIHDELSFDSFHPDSDRIYRIVLQGRVQGKDVHTTRIGTPVAKALQGSLTSVASTARLVTWPTFPMRFENKRFTEPYLLLADSNFFTFFHFNLIVGDTNSVLNGPHKIVLSESAAKKYFDYKGNGDTTPIGKTLVLAQGYEAQVSGIAEDPPANGHFHFTAILSLASWDETNATSWTTGRVITYFKLKPGAALDDVQTTLQDFVRQYVNPELEHVRKLDIQKFTSEGNVLRFKIQPLLKIHLHSNLDDEIEKNGDIQYIYLFSSIAAFIILLACINFMNLSTARASTRAKEVGVRKVVGASSGRLVIQFLLESFLYVFIAMVLAMFMIMVLIGPFNILAGKNLSLATLFSPAFLSGSLVFLMVTGLLAGSYPSFYLTQFSPVEVLKGRIRIKLRSYNIRNVLVVFQFFISVSLIIATITVYLQLQYLHDVQVGFDKHQLVQLLHTANLRKNGKAFKEALLKQDGIVAASYCNRVPPHITWQYNFRPTHAQQDYILYVYEMDYDHLSTLHLSMVKGRFFSPDFPGDTSAVILNEKAVEKLQLTHAGEQHLFTDYGDEHGTEREVIGVMKDFNFQSLRDSIQPMAIVLSRQPNWEMVIRLKGENQEKTLQTIYALWKKFAPDAPFEYSFVDKNFDDSLKTEKKIGLLFILFTTLAILIACLGLFGLATFMAEQRTKEIGVRKVVGASTSNIVRMLNRDFLKLVAIANLFAWPCSAWILYQWLSQFAYHTSIPWWAYSVAGLASLFIAFIAVSVQAWRAANGNPVNSLRDE
jgi:putative ABC transport system permease protein